MDLKTFASAISQIVEEKGIPQEKVLETIEAALAAAYKRDYASRGEQIRISLDPESGKMKVFKVMLVVDESMLKPEEESEGDEEEIQGKQRGGRSAKARNASRQEETPPIDEDDGRVRFNPERHMMIAEAKKIQKGIKTGEELLIELEPHEDFGRIAAQTAKQVIIQRLREAEREAIVDEYKDKQGELVSGIVQRVEGRTVYVDLGRGIGMLFPQEQIPGEYYRIGSRLRTLLLEVNMSQRGPQIILSRSHPEFVKNLFVLDVPEIEAGVVEIKGVAREAGFRTKVAVHSNQEGVDPIGACVGQRGTRVMAITNELNGEKIDIIEWDEDPERFVANAMSPAKVVDVELKARSVATVLVPDDQLSLAIGREGQNVRLAVKLTNWKIEVRGDSQAESEAPQAVAEIGGEVIIQGEEAEDVGETGKAEEIAGAEKAKEALATTGEKKRKKKTDAKAAKVTTEAKGSKTKTTKRASPKKKTA
ncbi:MAG: hypothetical protein A2806_01460 [Candidatus Terrybacteria bacterium RIFCSPHIGHO2_01_FULL_48_17]|uniref:Transcription termination/antitermination protein NusA n=1 Tax=Candidatus Terrybacteria bacterium RIFCSPHIGHO2_01_FULL_48_17 TaxID=1802362 RepID=A0A1G2PHB9_9BACT|nr:MAG: hypothetical protein A2806_01460 [Candidatus Terrybacteria bacterium RIFCSPHIGHO2_01_FULL_48_17]OHA52267.1 MAG: hypothetical protein A3A30_04715 [Candidatus Terrybacteria bacterium RIFCSPLOWO2_01_FULL_48_14]